VRNFGFITVTGQREGDTWRRARRSRDLWAELAEAAGITVLHQGLWVLGRRPLAAQVLEEFLETPMGQECRLFSAQETAAHAPALRTEHATAALYSPHELRVESRWALPRFAAWLQAHHGVAFHWGEAVMGVEGDTVVTAARRLRAERIVACPGTWLNGLAKPWLAQMQASLHLSRLQMLRIQPEPGFRLPGAVMSDLSLVRYAGYTPLPSSPALLRQLQEEQAAELAAGIHLIAVQSGDGSLVVGDSHEDDDSASPFANEAFDRLILEELRQTLHLEQATVVERWTGVYPVGHNQDALIHAPEPNQRLVLVTSGTGASTAFGIAEDVFNAW
jgi:D-hydroxyproline dehydrogenase subunit beta